MKKIEFAKNEITPIVANIRSNINTAMMFERLIEIVNSYKNSSSTKRLDTIIKMLLDTKQLVLANHSPASLERLSQDLLLFFADPMFLEEE